ncbi:type IV secretion system protein [Ramlibacter sp. AN1133]|uniref:type IV secretion system protein n=1 Tax=Ramlibacter sp. AN1133 TaxID=3133429 RepID=UPI0030BB903E
MNTRGIDMGLWNPLRKRSRPDSPKAAAACLQSAPNTPASLYQQAEGKFAEIYGSALVSANRSFLVACGCIIVALASIASVATILPLKEVRPWVVEVNPASGVVNKPVQIDRIDPSTAVVKSELARWAEAVYAIDPLRSGEALRWANARSADKAVAQFAEFRARERIYERMRSEPDMVREAKVAAVDVSRKGTAFIYVITSERVGAGGPEPARSRRMRVTLNYRLLPPTQEAELLANPLGLYVTFFSDTEERAQ